MLFLYFRYTQVITNSALFSSCICISYLSLAFVALQHQVLQRLLHQSIAVTKWECTNNIVTILQIYLELLSSHLCRTGFPPLLVNLYECMQAEFSHLFSSVTIRSPLFFRSWPHVSLKLCFSVGHRHVHDTSKLRQTNADTWRKQKLCVPFEGSR